MNMLHNKRENETFLKPVRHQMDTAGTVWIGPAAVYRKIRPEYREAALRFLKSTLFEELVSKRLFPKTTIAPDSPTCGDLVLQHERAPFILGAWEWSFTMLKDAVLTLLSVADLCEKHGYFLQDAHVYNVVFFCGRPLFVDFGSLREGKAHRSFPRNELLRHGYMPLKLWSEGNFYIANCLLRDLLQGNRLQPFINAEESPLLRRLSKPFIRPIGAGYLLRRLANIALWRIPGLRNRVFDLSHYGRMDFSTGEMRKRIESLQAPTDRTEWEAYHDASFETGTVTPRFNRIMEILGAHPWNTAVDVAGNSGYFTELLARRFPDARFLCLDYDSRAIDSQYRRIRESKDLEDRITVGMANIMYPQCLLLQLEDRIRADLVLALAVSHHLILRQKADFDVLLQYFDRISRRFLAIEFMPLGLWNGKETKPIPEWYTNEWFRARLAARFRILAEEQLEPNRILYFCEKLNPEPPGEKVAAALSPAEIISWDGSIP